VSNEIAFFDNLYSPYKKNKINQQKVKNARKQKKNKKNIF